MKLDPRHLEIIAAIVDCGGLTEAARFLGKSQPSVSRTLCEVEKRIGAKLFLPARRPLQATPLGLELAAHGRQVRSAGEAASAVIGRFGTRMDATIRIGGTPIFMEGVVSPMIAEFQQAFPDLRVDQHYSYAPDLVADLLDGALDLAICPLRTDAIPKALSFGAILPGRNVLVARVGHPLAAQGRLSPSNLAAYPWIAPPTTSPLYKDLRRTLRDIGADELKIRFSSGTLASVLGILANSDALTVLPYSVVVHPSRRAGLATLPFDVAHPQRRLGILSRRAALPAAPASLRAFLADRLREMASDLEAERTGRPRAPIRPTL